MTSETTHIKSLCNKCPVKSTCGIYIGLRIVHDKDGNTIECNRYDFYTQESEE